MQIIALLIIGTAAGFIATRLMRIEADMPTTIAIGVIGALIGGLVTRALIAITGIAAGLVGATLGALLLLLLWRKFGPRG